MSFFQTSLALFPLSGKFSGKFDETPLVFLELECFEMYLNFRLQNFFFLFPFFLSQLKHAPQLLGLVVYLSEVG